MKKLLLITMFICIAIPAMAECKGDADGDGDVDINDLNSMTLLLTDPRWYVDVWPGSCSNPPYVCQYIVYSTDEGYVSVFDFDGDDDIDIDDLNDLTLLLVNNKTWVIAPGTCVGPPYICQYLYICPE